LSTFSIEVVGDQGLEETTGMTGLGVQDGVGVSTRAMESSHQ